MTNSILLSTAAYELAETRAYHTTQDIYVYTHTQKKIKIK